MTFRVAAGVAVLMLALAGCGGGDKVVAEAGGPGGGASSGDAPAFNGAPTLDPTPTASPSATASPRPTATPDVVDLDETAASPPNEVPPNEPPAGKAPAGTTDGAELVVARPGMANTHTVTFDTTEVRSARTIRVYFYGGVEPCSVLDSAEVVETDSAVTITLRSGSDPAKPDAMCIQIAKYKAVDVVLSKDLGDREILDGSAEN
jgi:hypothetical protein